VRLGELCSTFVKEIFDINADSYEGEGVPFVRILNLRNGAIEDGNLAFIPEQIHAAEARTEMLFGDFILSKTAYPAASFVTLNRCNISQDTIGARLSPEGAAQYQSAAIVAYLNSGYGMRLMWRQFQGNVQMHLSLDDGRKIPIPAFGSEFQSAIVKVLSVAQERRKQAKDNANDADAVLLSALHFPDAVKLAGPLTFTRRASEVFAVRRLDAERFSPQVEALLAALNAGHKTVGDVANLREERFTAVLSPFDYIEIGDVRLDGSAAHTREL